MKVLVLLLSLLCITEGFNLKITNFTFTSSDSEVAEVLHTGYHLTKYNISVLIKKPLRKILVIENFIKDFASPRIFIFRCSSCFK